MFRLCSGDMVENFHLHVMTIFVNASCLHLTMVTFDLIVAS